MSSTERIFVTGAAGFIGGRVVERACLSGNYQVRAGVHRWASAARLGRFAVEICKCNIRDDQELARALDGVTAVIHCAVGPREVTVDGTRQLLAAAHRQGVKRFVHISTCDVYGAEQGEVDETAPRLGRGNPYAIMKNDAEDVVWDFSARGLPVTVLRPTIVYGPFSKSWSIRYAKRICADKWGTLGATADGRCNLIYVDDLAMAALRATEHPAAVGEAFNVNGTDMVTWNEYFEQLNAAMGRPPLPRMNPAFVRLRSTVMSPVRTAAQMLLKHFKERIFKIYARSFAARGAMQGTEKLLGLTPTLDELKLYGRTAHFSNNKLQSTLEFRPKVSLDIGLPATVAWLRHHAFI